MRGVAPPLASNTNQQVAVTRTTAMTNQIIKGQIFFVYVPARTSILGVGGIIIRANEQDAREVATDVDGAWVQSSFYLN